MKIGSKETNKVTKQKIEKVLQMARLLSRESSENQD